MAEQALHKFLRGWSDGSFRTERMFLSAVVPKFISILGYSNRQLFFGEALDFERIMMADAIVAAGRTRRPWLLIETKISRGRISDARLLEWKIQLKTYSSAVNPEYAVLIAPTLLLIIRGGC